MTPSHGVDRDWPEGPELIDLDDIGSAGVPYMERWGSTAPPADELLTRPEYLTKAQAGEIVQLHPKTIERAILVCKTTSIEPADLPVRVNDARNAPAGKSLAEIEQQHIKRMLEEAGWNVYRASRLLGIDRVTLYNKIKKYGFHRESANA